jgi:membrane-bound lytic murein transglycosylase B
LSTRRTQANHSGRDFADLPKKPNSNGKPTARFSLTDARVDGGTRFWSAARTGACKQISAPNIRLNPEIIVAIIGVETSYGRNTGSYRVVDALSTLAFDYPPRAAFFRKELREFLLLAQRAESGSTDPDRLLRRRHGVWPVHALQLPGNFAVDYDQDGFADIWHNTRDAIASVAQLFPETRLA